MTTTTGVMEFLMFRLPIDDSEFVFLGRQATLHPDHFPPEVLTYEQWQQLKPEAKSMFSGWIKGAFRGGKKEMQESMHQNLGFIIATAPTWDRFVSSSGSDVNAEIVDREDKSSLLLLVKAFDYFLAVVEGFCNLKQLEHEALRFNLQEGKGSVIKEEKEKTAQLIC
ncbi:hypothetical protein Vadar_010205 [Vaccinium darrowii]|uniref:Uncharacterized protein n=1 Tax=Vaccinium darrowii TaxID=229202 RepID=A0ACB7Z3J7_9ERIC|nr:hypothetical protein Vadar_010205 [Vaccinium darrowii]